MFCENCGTNMGELENCPQCVGQDEVGENVAAEVSVTTPQQPSQEIITKGIEGLAKKVDRKLAIGVSAIAVIILVVIGAVKVIDGGKSSIKESVIGQILTLRDGNDYKISKKDIKSIGKIEKSKDREGNSNFEITKSDIVLETEEFKAVGDVEIIKNRDHEQVILNLRYLPVLGVASEIIEADLEDMYLELDNDIDIYIPDYNLTVVSIESEKEEFEDATMSNKANIILEGDVFKITGTVMMDYVFDRGIWELQSFEAKEFDTAYADGKDLVFSLDDLLNEYNRGRINVSLVGNEEVYPLITKETLTESGIESINLYNKKVILNLNHTTPFYDLKGKIYVHYTLYNDGWELSHVEAEPSYTFNLVGNYTGWYELPRSWYSDVAKRNNAKLEITKVNNSTGYYEGVFNFEESVTDDENNESILEGSYYITGKYTPMNNGGGDQWNMKAEKWIQQAEGVSLTNLTGVVDYEGNMFKGDIVSYSDTFELKKTK